MKKLTLIAAAGLLVACSAPKENTLKDTFADHFYMGTALNEAQITGLDTKGVETTIKHFNSIVAENCMKSEEIHPEEGVYNFTLADKFVEFGEANDMFIIGHCLIWHSQLAEWFAYDDNGNYVTPEVFKERMKDHITTIMTRYKGRIHGYVEGFMDGEVDAIVRGRVHAAVVSGNLALDMKEANPDAVAQAKREYLAGAAVRESGKEGVVEHEA